MAPDNGPPAKFLRNLYNYLNTRSTRGFTMHFLHWCGISASLRGSRPVTPQPTNAKYAGFCRTGARPCEVPSGICISIEDLVFHCSGLLVVLLVLLSVLLSPSVGMDSRLQLVLPLVSPSDCWRLLVPPLVLPLVCAQLPEEARNLGEYLYHQCPRCAGVPGRSFGVGLSSIVLNHPRC